MYIYAGIMVISLAGPLLLSFDKKVAFYRSWPALFAGILVNGILFILWDIWFTRQNIWSFNPHYLFNIRFMNLPLEEWSFFLIIPYASVFIYACIKAYYPKNSLNPYVYLINYFFIIICFLAIVFFHDRTYTLVNCSIALILLCVQQFWIKGKYMGTFWIAYFVHLIPFLLVNGVLTGAFTAEPIIIYNSNEIMGWLFYTIPVEDAIYALSCLLIPVSILEYLGNNKS